MEIIHSTQPNLQDLIQRITICATELMNINEELSTLAKGIQNQLGPIFVDSAFDKHIENSLERNMKNFDETS